MALCFCLFPERHAGLVILVLKIAVLPVKLVVIALILFPEEKGSLAALIHEILCQFQVLRITGDGVEPHQRHFDDGMTGIAVQLFRFRAENAVNMIHEPDHRIQ